MDSLAFYLSENESSDDDVESRDLNIQRKHLRLKSNIFNVNNSEFKKLFRLTKEAFKYVLNEIECEYPSRTSTSITPTIKLAATLRFLAQGSYQKSVGQDLHVGYCQQSISRVINETINIMQRKLCPKWISLEMSTAEKAEIKREFYLKGAFPGVIGCVDGSLIKIIKPAENEHIYFSRKGYHAINAMFICDNALRIRAVNARYGGSCHDSMIWNLSPEKKYIVDNWTNDKTSWILGDSGYPLEPWIMTPYRAAAPNSQEAKYNTIHAKTRNPVERCIGVLKGRFRCLLAARELHYTPEKCTKIINVCSMLHNICIHYSLNDENNDEDDSEYVEDNENVSSQTMQNEAVRIRNQIKDAL